MQVARNKNWSGFVPLFVVMMAVVYATGCSDAASKASQPPALNVLAIFPADGAASIPVNTAITVAFNQEIDITSVTDATFVVRSNSKAVAGTLSYKNKWAQFLPTEALAPNAEYSADVTAAIKSQGGQTLSKSVAWKFTTGPLADSTAPSVIDTQPAADAQDVPTNSKVIVSFSERIRVAVVSDANFSIKRGDVAVAGALQASESVLSFSPTVALTEAATYSVTVQGILDLAGNPLAAAKTWSFTVGSSRDAVAPTLLSSSPPSGTENLPATFAMTLQFSEALDASTITSNTVIFAAGNGTVALVEANYIASSNSIVLTPQANLSYSTTDTLTLDGLTDAVGNRLALMKLSFKTELDTDSDLMPDSWETLNGTEPATADATLDPDADNLTNLDEFRHATDPKKPDTDSDGALDGDEVQQGRNPLINEPAILAIINDLILND